MRKPIEDIRMKLEKEFGVLGNDIKYDNHNDKYRVNPPCNPISRSGLREKVRLLNIVLDFCTLSYEKGSDFVDDILIQENQSLKEQLKILISIAHKNYKDFPIGDYLHGLTTEDYQLFVENNDLEKILELKKKLKETVSHMKWIYDEAKKTQYIDERTIASIENYLKSIEKDSK
jgi:hypothetical protein